MAAQAAEARRPGPLRSLSREQVLDAALEIMSDEGLDAVSFRSVSKRLGVNPMALYTYVKNKDELLAGMFDTVVQQLEMSLGDPGVPAEDQLIEYFVAARRMIIENADLYRIARPVGVPGADWDMIERIYSLFAAVGLPPAALVETQLTLIQYTIGNALFWASLGPAGLAPLMQSGGDAIAELDPQSYPHLCNTFRTDAESVDPETTFAATVRSIIRTAVSHRGFASTGNSKPATRRRRKEKS